MEKLKRVMSVIIAYMLLLQSIPMEIYAEVIKDLKTTLGDIGIVSTLNLIEGQTDLEIAEDRGIVMGTDERARFKLSITPQNIYVGQLEGIVTKIEVPQVIRESNGEYKVVYDLDRDDPRVIGGIELSVEGGDEWKEANLPQVRETVEIPRSAGLRAGVTSTINVEARMWTKQGEKLPEQIRMEIRVTSYVDQYTDGEGNTHTLGYQEKVNKEARHVIINSNLIYNAKIEQVTDEPAIVYKKYNYLEFQVTIENNSKVEEPYFDEHEFLMEIPHMDEEEIGIDDQLISRWEYDEKTGEITERSPEEIKENVKGMFVGKEEKGGILIYDVTDYNLKVSDSLPEELGDEDTIPYTNTGLGLIGFKISQAEENKVSSPTAPETDKVTKKVYRVKIPFPNMMAGDPPFRIKVGLNYTVGYGDPLIRTSKKTEGWGEFIREAPNVGVTKEVYGTDNGFIGEISRFVIKDVRNEGRVPVFNPKVEDSLPEGYKMVGLKYKVDGATTEGLESYLEKGKEIELEVEQLGSGLKTWIVASFKPEKKTTQGKEWEVDIEGIETMLSQQGMKLTGSFRVNYLTADREEAILEDGQLHRVLKRGEKIEGELIIEGELESLYKEYVNDAKLYVDYKSYDYKNQKYITVLKGPYVSTAKIELVKPDIYVNPTAYNNKLNPEYEAKRVGGDLDEETSGYFIRVGSRNKSDIYDNKTTINIPINSDNEGYVVKRIKISKEYVENLKINWMELSTTSEGSSRYTANQLEKYIQADGSMVIESSEWESLEGELNRIVLDLTKIESEGGLVTNAPYIKLEGKPNKAGEFELRTHIITRGPEPEFEIEKEGYATIDVGAMEPSIEGKVYVNGGASAGASSEVIKYEERDLKIEYKVGNKGTSTVPAEYVMDLPYELHNGKEKGIVSEKIRIKAGYERIGEIEKIELYHIGNESYREAEGSGLREADVVIDKQDLVNYKTATGDIEIELPQGVSGFVVKFESMKKKDYEEELQEIDKVKIEVEGYSTNAYNTLAIKGELNCLHPRMLDKKAKRVVSYTVTEPEVEINVHFLAYHGEGEIEAESPNLDSKYTRPTDKTIEKMGVPYERDVVYQYRLSNPSISVAEKFEGDIYFDVNSTTLGAEGGRGFHAEEIKIKENVFKIVDIRLIKLIDVDGREIELRVKPSKLEMYEGGVKKREYETSKDVVIDLKLEGMKNLKKIELRGERFESNIAKEVLAEVDNELAKNAIEVRGYSDSELGTHNESIADTRQTIVSMGDAEDRIKKKNDIGVLTVSKMYFDTVLSASYKEKGEEDRYTRTATVEEHKRKEYRIQDYENNDYTIDKSYEDDVELQIGYKSIGSIGVDFRQYNIDSEEVDLAGGFDEKYYYLDHETAAKKLGISAYGGNRDRDIYPEIGQYQHIRKYAYNTEAGIEIEVDIPNEGFEAYYIKIDPRTRKELESITIVREDGSKEEVGVEKWVDNGVDKEGNLTYWRLNLLGEVVSFENYSDIEEEGHTYYKSPASPYTIGENKVDKVIFKMHINKEEVDDNGIAKEVEFGTWYEDMPYQTGKDYKEVDEEGNPVTEDDMSYAWNQNMFEIVGRYYKEGNYKATASTRVEIGGKRGTASRVDEGSPKQKQSEYSYANRYYYWRHVATVSNTPIYCQYGEFYNAKDVYTEVDIEVVDRPWITAEKGAEVSNIQKDIKIVYGEEKKYVIDIKKDIEARTTKYQGYFELREDDWLYPIEPEKGGISKGFLPKYQHLDKVEIEDELPPLEYNQTTGQYEGFKTTKIRIKKESLKNIDELKVTTTLGKEYIYIPTDFDKEQGEWYEIGIKYPNEVGVGGSVEIELEEGEYIERFKLNTKELWGDVDVSSEFEGADREGVSEVPGEDIEVIGNVYDIADVGETATDKELSKPFNTRDRKGRNKVELKLYTDSQGQGETPRTLIQEDAVMKVRRTPIKAEYVIKQGDIDKTSDQEKDWSIDYQDSKGVLSEESKPHIETYKVYVWNGGNIYYKPGTTIVDPVEKDGEIGYIKYTNKLPECFRMKKLRIPEEVYNGSRWYVKSFEIEEVTGKKVDVLKEFKLVNGWYELDIERLFKEGILTKPQVQTGEDLLKLELSSYTIEVESKTPYDLTNQLLPLEDENDPRKYLIDKDTAMLEYEGIWVDKKEKDWDNDIWTEENSEPTVGKDKFSYTDYASAETDTTLEGVDIQGFIQGTYVPSSHTQKDKTFATKVLNRIANISIEEVKEDNVLKSYATYKEGGVEKPTNYTSVLEGDRIEINWKIKAEPTVDYSNPGVPNIPNVPPQGTMSMKEPIIRYEAPTGMRIVRWIYKDVSSGIPKTVIQGEFKSTTTGGSITKAEEGVEYGGNEKILEIKIEDILEVGEEIEIEVELEVVDEKGIEDVDNSLTAKTTQGYNPVGVLEVTGASKYGHEPYTFTKADGEITKEGEYNKVTTDDKDKPVNPNIALIGEGKHNATYTTKGKATQGGLGIREGVGEVRSVLPYHQSSSVSLGFTWMPPSDYQKPKNIDTYDLELNVGNIVNDTLHPLKSKEVVIDFKEEDTYGRIVQTYYLREWVDLSQVRLDLIEGVDIYYLTDRTHPLRTGDVEPKWEKVIATTPRPEEFTKQGNPISAIKIEYRGVKALDGDIMVNLGDIVLEGTGRYIDERSPREISGGKVSASNESTIKVKGKVYNNYDYEGKIRQIRANSESSTKVIRYEPVLFVDTKPYNADGTRKDTYRPGDEVWYKSIVENMYDKATGSLLKPVFYDKVPEYLDYPELDEIEIVMTDINGDIVKRYDIEDNGVIITPNLPTTGGTIGGTTGSSIKEGKVIEKGVVKITREDIKGLDLGGNQALIKVDNVRKENGQSTGRYVEGKPVDIQTNKAEEINFRMYKYEFSDELPRGYKYEIRYKTRVKRVEELRVGLTHPITKWSINGREVPAYVPVIGEYDKFSTDSYLYDHLRNPMDDIDNTRGNVRDTVMDMSNIYHEVGASGELSYGVDRWEFLDESEIELPGYKNGSERDDWYYDDRADFLFDTDIKTGKRERGELRTVKEVDNNTVSGVYKVSNLDNYEHLLSGRTLRKDLGSLIESENIVWSMSGLHLMTAWLYTASSFETENSGTKDINSTGNTVEVWTKSGTSPEDSDTRFTWIDEDQSIIGLEYGEEFTTRLYGTNYGDWDLDGVEFIYTMPSGVEPIINESTTTGTIVDSLGIKAEYIEGTGLAGVDKKHTELKEQLDEKGHTTQYKNVVEIPKDLIEVEVLQNPYTDIGVYKAPKEYQEARHKDTGKDNYYTKEVPWVLKITVKSELGKWYNRGTKENYRIRVSIPSRVYKENENEMWYDEVYAKPYDKDKEAEIKNSDCYQIYSVDQWSGDTLDPVSQDLQGYGMERRLVHTSMYSYYDELNFYSPNTEYVNGYNVQCSEVMTGQYTEGELEKYAQSGTRAIKKKGFMRMWVETGEREKSSDILRKDQFYYEAELGQEEIRVVIDNRYVRAMNPNNRNELAFSNYDIDGGYKGSIIEPVFRVLLPKGIVPTDERGVPILLEKGEKRENVEGVKWTVATRKWETNRVVKDTTSQAYIDKVKSLYEIDIEHHGGILTSSAKEGRYEITVRPKLNKNYESVRTSDLVRVKSEEMLTVSVGVLMVEDMPDPKNIKVEAKVESAISKQEIVADIDVMNNNIEDTIGGDPEGKNEPLIHETRDYRTGVPFNQDEKYEGDYYPIPIVDNNADYRLDAHFIKNETNPMDDYDYEQSGRVELDVDNRTRFIGVMGTYNVLGKDMRGGVNTLLLREAKPLLKLEKKLIQGLEGDKFKYNEDVYYEIKVTNDNSKLETTASIKHSKIELIDYIPNPLVWEGEMWIEYTANDGQKRIVSIEDAEAEGWGVRAELISNPLSATVLGHTDASVLRVELITPKEEGGKGQEEIYVDNKLPEGSLRPGETFKVWVKTRVSELQPNEDMKVTSIWYDNFRNTVYGDLIERDGSYIEGEAFAKTDVVGYVNEVDEQSAGCDINGDGDMQDTFSSTSAGEIGVISPRIGLRLDTLSQNQMSYDPISGITTFDYSKHKIVGSVDLLVTEARLKRGQVSEFVLQYDLPYRGTDKMKEPITQEHTPIETYVKEISTGVWEIPSGYVNQSLLEERLKVYVYYLERNDDKYTHIADKEDTTKNWVLLNPDKDGDGIKEGIGLKANEVLEIPEEAKNVRQLRFVIKDELGELVIPEGFRLDVDADLSTPDKEELDVVDPARMHATDIYQGGNVVDNSIRVTVEHNWVDAITTRKYVEHYITADAKYDDTKYSEGLSKDSNGYIMTPENPSMGLSYEAKYFRGELINIGTPERPAFQTEYSWNEKVFINPNSTIIREKLRLSNVPEDISNHKADILSNPSLALALPKIMRNPEGKFRYIPYEEITSDHILHDEYKSSKSYGINKELYWTWYVVDENGERVEDPELRFEPADDKGQPHVYKSYVDYTQEKRVVRWDFKGKLLPGQTIIVLSLLEIEELLGGAFKDEDVRFRYYGIKDSTFTPYILENGENKVALFVDTVDIDKDGDLYEQTLMLRNESMRFESYDNFIRNKRVETENDVTGALTSVPLPLPEGGEFTYYNRVQNTSEKSEGYRLPVQLDILPHEGDEYMLGRVTTSGTITGVERLSNWEGILDVNSFELIENIKGNERVVEESEYEVLVGPLKKTEEGLLEEGTYPEVEYRSIPGFFEDMEEMPRMDGLDKEGSLEDYFVTVEDFNKYLDGVDNEYTKEELRRSVTMFYVRFKDTYGVMEGNSAYVLKYDMEAPLNLPISQGIKSNEGSYGDTVIYNTFSPWAKRPGMYPGESNRSGVYLNADEGRGYIGDYVWYDINGNGDFRDEGEYGTPRKETLRDVRLTTEGAVGDANGDGKDTRVDINGDGVLDEKDDAGINGVKVELLTKEGYPADKEGNAVVLEGDKYRVIDEETGEYKEGELGLPVYGREPKVTETKFDYYLNKGYYVLSDIKPGEYRLRFTFPKGYDHYEVSTDKISQSKYQVYRQGEKLPDLKGNLGVEGDGEEVESLTIVTEAFKVEGFEVGTEDEMLAYDRKATSYDVGITLPVSYGGEVWLDRESLVIGDELESTTDSTVGEKENTKVTNKAHSKSNGTGNGVMDKGEELLSGVKLKMYEVLDNGNLIEAVDLKGNPLETITNEKGAYLFEGIRPERNYKIRIVGGVNTLLTTPIYEPDALKEDGDNNGNVVLYGKDDSYIETGVFKAQLPRDEEGRLIYEDETKTKYAKNTKIDIGLIDEVGTIGDRVWLDENGNGLQEDGEKGVEGIGIVLERYYVNESGGLERIKGDLKTITNKEGYYLFRGLSSYHTTEEGKTYLQVFKLRVEGIDKTKYNITEEGKGGVESLDSDLHRGSMYLHGEEGVVIIAPRATSMTETKYIRSYKGAKYDIGERVSDYTNDIGLLDYRVQGVVWRDKNKDGIRQEDREPLLEGIEVELYREKILIPEIDIPTTTEGSIIEGITTEGSIIEGITTEGSIIEGTTEGSIQGEITKQEPLLGRMFSFLRTTIIDEFASLKEPTKELEGEYEYVGKTVTNTEGEYVFEGLEGLKENPSTGECYAIGYIVKVNGCKTRKVTKYKEGKDIKKDNDFKKVVGGVVKVEGGIISDGASVTEKLRVADIQEVDEEGFPKYINQKYNDLGYIFKEDTSIILNPSANEDNDDDGLGQEEIDKEETGLGNPSIEIEMNNPPVIYRPYLPPILYNPYLPPVIYNPYLPPIIYTQKEDGGNPDGGNPDGGNPDGGNPDGGSGDGDEGLQTADSSIMYIGILVLSWALGGITKVVVRKRKMGDGE